MSWPIRGLSLDLRAQGIRSSACRILGAVAHRPCRHLLPSFRAHRRLIDFENGALRPQGEWTSSLIIMCKQAAPLQAGHLGAACLNSRDGSNATR